MGPSYQHGSPLQKEGFIANSECITVPSSTAAKSKLDKRERRKGSQTAALMNPSSLEPSSRHVRSGWKPRQKAQRARRGRPAGWPSITRTGRAWGDGTMEAPTEIAENQVVALRQGKSLVLPKLQFSHLQKDDNTTSQDSCE